MTEKNGLENYLHGLGIEFKDLKLFRQAFTHRSYLNENRRSGLHHNERLEFLGDAVLELVVTDFLYHKYPQKTEGEMTAFRSALVNTTTLSTVANDLNINDHLFLSRGETKDSGRARQCILANTFESLLGAIYLDQGYQEAARFVEKHLLARTDEIVKNNTWRDPKSSFQEKAQEVTGITPRYQVLSESGPDHDKSFTVGLYLGSELVATGDGHSKQEAEQKAAEAGLEIRKWSD